MGEAVLVRIGTEQGVRTLTLDSQANRNALSARLVGELMAGLDAAAQDPLVRVVVLAAAGRAFCSGADLTEMGGPDRARGTDGLLALQRRILTLPQPVLARVQGPARAGGLGILGACDLVVAAASASFAFTEVRVGVAPAVISLTVLPRLAARQAAAAFLTGDPLDAATAQACGLVTVAVPDEDLDAAVARLTGSLLAGAPGAQAETKRLLNRPLVERLESEGTEIAQLSARLFGSAEAAEGMAAFLERRPASWATSG